MRLSRQQIVRLAPFAVLLLVVLAAMLVEPRFFGPANLRNVARGAAFLSVVAVGQLLVVIVRGLDLSVGAVITTTLLLTVEIAGTVEGRLPLAILAVIVAAVAIGALNAFLVVMRRVPVILATLSTFFLIQGAGLWLTEGRSRGRVPDELRVIGSGVIGGTVPVAVVIAAVVAVVVALILARTTFGRSIYAVGANPDAAHLSGVARRRTTTLALIGCSSLAMLAGLMLAGHVGFYDRTLGVGYDLDSISAVVLGGASLMGGSGRVGATVAAAVGLAALDNLLLLVGAPQPVQLIAKGLVLFLAVLAAGWLFRPAGEDASRSPMSA